MTYDLAVIGGGNMGAALVSGLLDAGALDATTIAIVETVTARRDELTKLFPDVAITADVPACNAAVLAVKPPDVPAVAAAVAAAGARRVLSIAAGVTTTTIAAAVGPEVAVIRAMPNTPALVGRGVAAIAGGPGADDAALEWAESILGAVGLTVRLGEQHFDAVTGLTGSGPAYVFLVAEALVDAGVLAGIPRATVDTMVAGLLSGSAELLMQRGDPAALRAMVTSPGGTTAAGLAVLERSAVRAAFIDAVRAAATRSRELGA